MFYGRNYRVLLYIIFCVGLYPLYVLTTSTEKNEEIKEVGPNSSKQNLSENVLIKQPVTQKLNLESNIEKVELIEPLVKPVIVLKKLLKKLCLQFL